MTGRAPGRREPVDATDVSGLATPGARRALLYVVATGAAQVALLWPVLARPWLVVVALAATAAAAVLLTAPTSDPLALRAAVPVAALPAVNAACALPQLDPSHPERVWVLAISGCLGGLLAVRGRVLLPWVGAATAVAVVTAWAIAHGAGPGEPVSIALLFTGLVAAGALWRRMLDRHVATVRSHRSDEARTMLAEAATRDAVATAEAELHAIGREAAPLLRRIAAGGTLTPAERAEVRLLEARLRDRVRAKALAREPVAEACDRARRNGTDVLLLDDGGGAGELPPQLLERVAGLVGGVAHGRVTVRVLPPGRDALVTVLVDQGGRVRAEVLGPAGTIVRSTSHQLSG